MDESNIWRRYQVIVTFFQISRTYHFSQKYAGRYLSSPKSLCKIFHAGNLIARCCRDLSNAVAHCPGADDEDIFDVHFYILFYFCFQILFAG